MTSLPSNTSVLAALRQDLEAWMHDAAPVLQQAGLRRLPLPAASRRTLAQFELRTPDAKRCSLGLLLAQVQTADGTHESLTWLASTPDETGEDCIFIQELCRKEGANALAGLREALLSTEPDSVLVWAKAELSTVGFEWPAP